MESFIIQYERLLMSSSEYLCANIEYAYYTLSLMIACEKLNPKKLTEVKPMMKFPKKWTNLIKDEFLQIEED